MERDALIRAQYERDAASAPTFAGRMRAREQLFAHGWAVDPWSAESLASALQGASIDEAGPVLLHAERFDELLAWLDARPEQDESSRVLRAMVAIRYGDNEAAAELLDRVPDPEAVALHGLALLQLGRADDAAARLEVLLAADALSNLGELAARLLPEAMPVLALFLTACVTASERLLARGDRDGASKFAFAARDALRRYETAEPPEGPSREEIAALLARLAPTA